MKTLKKIVKKYVNDQQSLFDYNKRDYDYDEVIILMQEVQKETLDLIGLNEGWEDTRDIYAKKLGLPEKYK